MFRLAYKDTYQIDRVLEYEDYEALMLSLSGCVTLPDTTVITSLTYISPMMEKKSIRAF